jgi:AcrR family transcriptional regulator
VSDTAPRVTGRAPSGRRDRSRRAPRPTERQRDADRTRERILDAALGEFADKGYAGARVRQIAGRAGVNAQLISYYFGGKEGLYKELVQRWHSWEAGVDEAGLSFADVNAAYLQATFDRPELMRMFIWEGLAAGGGSSEGAPWPDSEGPDEVADLRRRQAVGEVTDDVDAGYLMLALMGILTTPVTLPHMVERLCGVRADSEEFRTRFPEQLRRIIGHLAGPAADRSAADPSSADPG